MTPPAMRSPAAPTRRAAAAATGVVLVVFATVMALAAPASAHTRLLSSDPANGATVATAPGTITLTFAEHLLGLGAVAVSGPDGNSALSGAAVLDGAVVTAPLASYRPAGRYTLSYRVVSADGHPVNGQVTFTATGGVGSASAASTPAGAPGTASPGAALPGGDESGGGSSTGTLVGIAVGVGLLAAVTGAVVAISARRRRQGSSTDGA